jgi:hypothetical protein
MIQNLNDFYLGIGLLILFVSAVIIQAKIEQIIQKRRERGGKW